MNFRLRSLDSLAQHFPPLKESGGVHFDRLHEFVDGDWNLNIDCLLSSHRSVSTIPKHQHQVQWQLFMQINLDSSKVFISPVFPLFFFKCFYLTQI